MNTFNFITTPTKTEKEYIRENKSRIETAKRKKKETIQLNKRKKEKLLHLSHKEWLSRLNISSLKEILQIIQPFRKYKIWDFNLDKEELLKLLHEFPEEQVIEAKNTFIQISNEQNDPLVIKQERCYYNMKFRKILFDLCKKLWISQSFIPFPSLLLETKGEEEEEEKKTTKWIFSDNKDLFFIQFLSNNNSTSTSFFILKNINTGLLFEPKISIVKGIYLESYSEKKAKDKNKNTFSFNSYINYILADYTRKHIGKDHPVRLHEPKKYSPYKEGKIIYIIHSALSSRYYIQLNKDIETLKKEKQEEESKSFSTSPFSSIPTYLWQPHLPKKLILLNSHLYSKASKSLRLDLYSLFDNHIRKDTFDMCLQKASSSSPLYVLSREPKLGEQICREIYKFL